MDINDIVRHMSRGVADAAPDHGYVATGFCYPDGDSVNIYLVEAPTMLVITDRGLTTDKLYGCGISLAKGHDVLLDYVGHRYGVTLDGAAFTRRVITLRLGRQCLDFCEAIIFVMGYMFDKKGD